jgi:hypothetical protein
MSAAKPDFLERWLRERFRLRQSLREAWEAVRIRDEQINATVKKLTVENTRLRNVTCNCERHESMVIKETANR